MPENEFGPSDAKALMDEIFAPWVAQMGLEAISFSPAQAEFRLGSDPDLALRGGPGDGLLCGQAVAAAADTVCVLALAGASGRFRNCTTVGMSVNYLRPLRGETDITVDIESNGRKLAVCRVTLREAGTRKASAMAAATFMYLE